MENEKWKWILDWPMFSFGPMKPIVDYMADIGFTYLLLPIITVGVAYQSSRAKGPKERMSHA